MDYLRGYREYKAREMIYEVLRRQEETARIDEKRSPVTLQVLQRAVAPERPVWPRRSLLAALLAALALAGSYIFYYLRDNAAVLPQYELQKLKAMALGAER